MFRSHRIIALDIGASRIAIAEFSVMKSRNVELLKYGIGKLGIEPEGETDSSAFIVSALRDLIREHGIKPAPVLMSMSGHAVFPRFIKLPPVTRDKVLQIIRYEAEQNVPFPIEEVVWDYQLIRGVNEGELSVMLVAVKIENVKNLTDCVLAAGMEPEVVDVAPMALYNTVRYNYPDLEGCTMVLDVGARSSNLIFLEGNRIFSRSIPVAGNAITWELAKEFELSFEEAEELKLTHAFVALGGVYAGPDSDVADRVSKVVRNVITRLHAEINRSTNFYRSQQDGSLPSLVLLTGGSSVIPHIDTFFREKLKVEVKHLNPFVKVAVGDEVDTAQIEKDLHLLGEVVGLALRRALSCPVEINLMPPDLVAKKVFRRRQPFFALAAVGVVLIMLCWWGYSRRMQTMLNGELDKVEWKIGNLRTVHSCLKEVVDKKNRARIKTDRITDIIALRTQWIEMLEAIHASMPEGMWIRSLTPIVEDGMITYITITGMGFDDKLEKLDKPDGTAIEVFRDRLRSLKYFSEQTQITRLPPYAGASIREFTIQAALKKPIGVR